MACINTADYRVRTINGWYYVCNLCCMKGHMFINALTPKETLPIESMHECQCEHGSHFRD